LTLRFYVTDFDLRLRLSNQRAYDTATAATAALEGDTRTLSARTAATTALLNAGKDKAANEVGVVSLIDWLSLTRSTHQPHALLIHEP
jgi:hypothetical protein